MKSQFLQLGLTAALAFMLVSRVTAQAFTTLLNFQKNVSMSSPYSGPNGGLILSGNTLYGTAYEGGSLSAGMVFSIQTNGTGFTNLHTGSGVATWRCFRLEWLNDIDDWRVSVFRKTPCLYIGAMRTPKFLE